MSVHIIEESSFPLLNLILREFKEIYENEYTHINSVIVGHSLGAF